jgi:hypothetical protein
MKVSHSALVASLVLARNVSAFAPLAFRPSAIAAARTSHNNYPRQKQQRLFANVAKLSDPQSELLDKTDVFIFDCDGVIWRVSGRHSCME